MLYQGTALDSRQLLKMNAYAKYYSPVIIAAMF